MLPSLLGVSNASLVAVIYVQNAKETDLFALFNCSLNIPIQVRRRYSHVHSVSETRQAGSKGLESLIMPLLYLSLGMSYLVKLTSIVWLCYIYIYIYIYISRCFIWSNTYVASIYLKVCLSNKFIPMPRGLNEKITLKTCKKFSSQC